MLLPTLEDYPFFLELYCDIYNAIKLVNPEIQIGSHFNLNY